MSHSSKVNLVRSAAARQVKMDAAQHVRGMCCLSKSNTNYFTYVSTAEDN